jgi:hypothetical protein
LTEGKVISVVKHCIVMIHDEVEVQLHARLTLSVHGSC